MDNYLKSYREMISLRGLTNQTITSYSTYISAYLDYLSCFLCRLPEDVFWQQMRDFILWLPYVPSQKNTWAFISTISDIKVNVFVTLLYSAGLRSCEVRHIKCSDIEHSSQRIFIRQIFEYGLEAFSSQATLFPAQEKAACSVINCRSGTLGCSISQCPDCGHTQLHLKAIWNRNIRVCPECGCLTMRQIGKVYAKPR